MRTQIIYVLVGSEKDLYLEELWVSLYSLRRFHPKRCPEFDKQTDFDFAHVKVLVDTDTDTYIKKFPSLINMIDEIVVVPTPIKYSAKQRSRQIKTTVRQVIKGDYLFIDTDTVICKSLSELDNLTCDIAAVPDGHCLVNDHLFRTSIINNIQQIFNIDYSHADYWYNSGIMYVKDKECTRTLYHRWNENWIQSCFQYGNSQDQPSLAAADFILGGIIRPLSDIYNAQLAMSLKYYADAAIVHWWHMNFIENQNYSPYFSLQIYKDIKNYGGITTKIAEQIINCKQTFATTSMPVGKEHILFLFSPAGRIFNRIYKDGGIASWLMLKVATLLEYIRKLTE